MEISYFPLSFYSTYSRVKSFLHFRLFFQSKSIIPKFEVCMWYPASLVLNLPLSDCTYSRLSVHTSIIHDHTISTIYFVSICLLTSLVRFMVSFLSWSEIGNISFHFWNVQFERVYIYFRLICRTNSNYWFENYLFIFAVV